MKISKKKGVALVAALVLIFVGAGLYSRKEVGAKPQKNTPLPPPLVKIESVTANHVIRDSIVQNMSIEAVNRVQMFPRVSGRLERLHVKQGDRVKAGQLIATLEHEQQDALIGAAEAQVASARAETERARAEMMNAQTNRDRSQRLVKEGFSTKQQYDTIETAFVSAKANHDAARAKERQIAAEVGRVKSTRMDYIMHSPMDGTVLNDYALVAGAMISPGSPIAEIADLRRLKATFRVPETKIFAVVPGMPVFLKFDALPGEEFTGKVSRIDPFVDPATRSSAVEIELNNEAVGNRLRPGMFGQASLVEREFKNAILIPESVVHSSDQGEYVFVEVNGIAKLRNVSIGLRQGNAVQITKGLKPGEKVIVFGGSNLKDGEKVDVQSGSKGS